MRIPFRFGIWTRLLLAFGSISTITLLAGLTALFVFDRSGDLFVTVTEEQLPQVVSVAEFADTCGQTIAIAPSLLSAPDEAGLERAAIDLERLLIQIKQQIPAINLKTSDAQTQINTLVEDLFINLSSLRSSVEKRLVLEKLLREESEQLRWLYADLLDEIEPLNQDFSYNLDTEIERLIEASLNSDNRFSAMRLKENRLAKEAIENIGNNSVLLVTLMFQASTAVDPEQIDHLVAVSQDTISFLRDSLEQLQSRASSLTLRQLLGEIFTLAESDSSVFSIKKRINLERSLGEHILTENRQLVAQLRTLTEAVVTTARNDAIRAVAASKRTVANARITLILMGFLSLLMAGAVLWFYVRGNIVARLNELGTGMQAIAAGDLNYPLPTVKDDEIGRMTSALGIFRDTAQAVEDANAQAIIDNADAGLIIAEIDGTIRFLNLAAVKLFDTSTDAMVNRSVFMLVIEQDHKALHDICHKVLDSEQQLVPAETLQGIRDNESQFPVEISVRRIYQRNNPRLIFTLHDVTERERAQELLKKRVRLKTDHLSKINVKLRQEVQARKKIQSELIQAGKMAALGQLATGIAHELNQPLSAISHYLHNSKILLERDDLQTHKENLAKVDDLTARMANIIIHLKTFARLPSETLSPVKLADSVERTISLFSGRISQLGIEIHKSFEEKGINVLAEDIRLDQVLVNIIGNAIDAVSEMPIGQREINIKSQSVEKFIKIDITDSGNGIEPNLLESIFDPFFTTKEVGKGLGLGLSISYNIIRDFGGKIEASNQPNSGARFSVWLQKVEVS